MRVALFIPCLLLALSGLAPAQPQPPATPQPSITAQQSTPAQPSPAGQLPAPPFDLKDPAAIAVGQEQFNRRCAGRCHGRDGQEGFDCPALVGKDYLNWPFVYATLLTGRPTTAMPNWAGRLSDDELWHIIAFVSSLADQAKAR